MACKFATLAASLAPSDVELIGGWLKDGRDTKGVRVSAETLALALSEVYEPIGPTTLKDHRGGRCACYRKAQ